MPIVHLSDSDAQLLAELVQRDNTLPGTIVESLQSPLPDIYSLIPSIEDAVGLAESSNQYPEGYQALSRALTAAWDAWKDVDS